MKLSFALPLISMLFISFLLNAQSKTQNTSSYYTRVTTRHISKEESQAAIERLTTEIELDKKNANLYSTRSSSEYFMGLYEEAMADINTAIKIDTTNNADFYVRRGFLKQQINSKTKQNKYTEAEMVSDFNIAIVLSKQNDKYNNRYDSRATLYSNINHYDLAIADMDTAIMMGRPSANLYITRAGYKDKSNSYPLNEILKDYEKSIALSKNENKIGPYMARAKFNASKKMFTNAITDLDSAIVFKDHIRGGFCYKDRGDYKKQSKLYSDSSIQADYNMANTLDSLKLYGNR